MSNSITVDKPMLKETLRHQKPGLTAKGDQRRFVKHNYIDHANEEIELSGVHGIDVTDRYELSCFNANGNDVKNTKRSPPFPLKLWMIIEIEDKYEDATIAWLPHGRGFFIRDSVLFSEVILPKYFKKCKISSFYRQLNLYSFIRLTSCRKSIAYYNEFFLRGKPNLTMRIVRTKVKGTKIRAASSPQDEPNFSSMTPLPYLSSNLRPAIKSTKSVVSVLKSSQDQDEHFLQQNQMLMAQRRNIYYDELMNTPRLTDDPLSTMLRYNDLASFTRNADSQIFGAICGNALCYNLETIMSAPHCYRDPVGLNSIRSNPYANFYPSLPITHTFSPPSTTLRSDTIPRSTFPSVASSSNYRHELAYPSNILAFSQGDMK